MNLIFPNVLYKGMNLIFPKVLYKANYNIHLADYTKYFGKTIQFVFILFFCFVFYTLKNERELCFF